MGSVWGWLWLGFSVGRVASGVWYLVRFLTSLRVCAGVVVAGCGLSGVGVRWGSAVARCSVVACLSLSCVCGCCSVARCGRWLPASLPCCRSMRGTQAGGAYRGPSWPHPDLVGWIGPGISCFVCLFVPLCCPLKVSSYPSEHRVPSEYRENRARCGDIVKMVKEPSCQAKLPGEAAAHPYDSHRNGTRGLPRFTSLHNYEGHAHYEHHVQSRASHASQRLRGPRPSARVSTSATRISHVGV